MLNVMHANLSYIGRAGLKSYISTGAGTRFVVVLFDSAVAAPLAVMGADVLGRYRTGAASGVATKHLYREKSGNLAVLGSGRQALTQALAMRSVLSVDRVWVWSPNAGHREDFARKLTESGFEASSSDSPGRALRGADVACSITSSKEPFVSGSMLESVRHFNAAGGNVPAHCELTADAVCQFPTVVVDDISQAKVEYGDLIQAAAAGSFSWESAMDLASVVAGKKVADGRTLFKSGGAALEDVAVASMLYDRAMKSGNNYPDVELV